MQYSERMAWLGTEGAFEVLARCKQLEAQGKSIIHLEIGEPDFDTPKNICDAAIKAIRDGHTHYSPSAGVPQAREAVAEYVSRTRGVPVTADRVVIMPGVKPLVFNAILATVNPGDEVIVPNPGYPAYESVVSYVGAHPIPLRLREENNFRFLIDDLKRLITSKTRMVVINSPQNPTGGVLTREDLEAICELAEKHDFWIMADEIYCRIIYDVKCESIAPIPGAMNRTILLDGMSKTYAMTGWRLGFAVVPPKLSEWLAKLAINTFSCTGTFSQYGMIEGLSGPQDDVDRMVAEFKRRRDIIVDGLNKIDGFHCLKPLGAFYVFPNIAETGMKSSALAELLLEQNGVACLSGTAFGKYGEGYLRFSYANSVENIKEALRRVEKALAGVRQVAK
ncbi:MAG TPA: pyridoxal phosphate-dependent aminotransferase [Candidatus Deferrimicrobium sp.]|nr:pyridoxal phosphate-dependent aminotransferase [Candidatus Deferrimicrobium sp.]